MKNVAIYKILSAIVFPLFLLIPTANAGTINYTLGNGSTGFVDGDTPGILEILNAQSGQAAPFNGVIGHSVITDPNNVNWLFNYGAITDTIINASLSFGIWDLDSAASGSQLDSFSVEGTDLTADLNTMFEVAATNYNEYNEFTLNFDNSFFANVADGLFSVDLDIGGQGFQTAFNESNFNRYFLLSSTLTIETEDVVMPGPDPKPVPEPTTLLLLAGAIAGLRLRASK